MKYRQRSLLVGDDGNDVEKERSAVEEAKRFRKICSTTRKYEGTGVEDFPGERGLLQLLLYLLLQDDLLRLAHVDLVVWKGDTHHRRDD